MQKKILIPIPSLDFDPSECAIAWQILVAAGVEVTFATPNGEKARCDQRMLTGDGLGILSPILAADKNARAAYGELEKSSEFNSPMKWKSSVASSFDGIVLPGGHAPGMKEYLESKHLQFIIRDFFQTKKPVGAICHGVVLVARSHYLNGKSVLFGKKTTGLLAVQELLAWAATYLWLGNYYRTYPQTVQAEVISNLDSPVAFLSGPAPLWRDRPDKLSNGFTVLDDNFLSARWPGDAYKFATDFLKLL